MPEFQNVVVVGLGYIGLPTAAVIASRGMRVVGVDVNERVVKTVASGAIHIAEPDLEGLVQKVVSSGSLKVATEPEAADVFIIAVPTPIDREKRADLGSVMKSVDSIVGVLRAGNLVILESTVPIGTTEEIAKKIADVRPDLRVGMADGSEHGISVAYCPERVLPGRILSELVNNDRCIGGVTPHCARRAQRFYKAFVRGACIATTARAAEMVKLTENAFRDTNIAFANELSLICHRYEINVWEVIDLARLIKTSRDVNDSMIDWTVERAAALIEEHPYANVACCGLAFKANVDDLRESPALEVAHQLASRYGARIKIVEPHIRKLPPQIAEHGAELTDLDEAIRTCEIAIVLVDHDHFKMIPLAERRHLAVIDTRGIWQDMPVRDR